MSTRVSFKRRDKATRRHIKATLEVGATMGEIMEVRARLSDGSVLEGDVVLASLGSIRNVEWLEGAGSCRASPQK